MLLQSLNEIVCEGLNVHEWEAGAGLLSSLLKTVSWGQKGLDLLLLPDGQEKLLTDDSPWEDLVKRPE